MTLINRVLFVRIVLWSCVGTVLFFAVSLVTTWASRPIWNSIQQSRHDADLISRYTVLASEKPAYVKALADSKLPLADHEILYADVSAELATAQLQNTMQNLVSEAGGQVQSSALGTPQIAHGLQVLTVAISLTLPSERLAPFLTSIETEKPYLVVLSADIRSAGAGNQSSPLAIQMQVEAFGQKSE